MYTVLFTTHYFNSSQKYLNKIHNPSENNESELSVRMLKNHSSLKHQNLKPPQFKRKKLGHCVKCQ